ncbi:MAG TPA: restriction endonuclease subunit S [Clostridia bacterium]|nr:restriction endonuclease subunit S [Clostridia bacterium]
MAIEEKVKFGELCEHSAFGPRFSSDEYCPDGNVATLRTTDINADGRIEYLTMPIARLDLSRFKQHILQQDDLVITRTGRVGTTAVFEHFDLPVLPGAFLIRFRLRRDAADPKFYRYFFNSRHGQALIKSIATGSVQQNLNITALHNLEVPLPSLAEQKSIASVLGALDDKIELNRRMNATLEAMARALFQSWFVDFDPVKAKAKGRKPLGLDAETAAFFPAEFQDSSLGPIPSGWSAERLPDVIEVNPRRALKAGAGAPYLDMKNMPTQGHCAEEVINREFTSGTKFQNGDTLFARITPCLENGKTALVDFLQDGQVGWGSTEYIVFAPKPPLPSQFAYYLARSNALRSHAIQNMVGTSGRQRVPAECFGSFLVAVPTPKVASIFGKITEPLIAKIKANTQESRKLASLRDTLLPKLLSGELAASLERNHHEPREH